MMVLRKRHPKAPPEWLVNESKAIIEGLHTYGMEVGPKDMFGPHECIHDRIDRAKRRGQQLPSTEDQLWAQMAKEISADWKERKPWASPELK
jgi:hypothetical protein